jgi:hypothetical protein
MAASRLNPRWITILSSLATDLQAWQDSGFSGALTYDQGYSISIQINL